MAAALLARATVTSTGEETTVQSTHAPPTAPPMATASTAPALATRAGRGTRVTSLRVWAAAAAMVCVSREDVTATWAGKGRVAVGTRAALTAATRAASAPQRGRASASEVTRVPTARLRHRARSHLPTARGTASARTLAPPQRAAAGWGGRARSAIRDPTRDRPRSLGREQHDTSRGRSRLWCLCTM